MTPRTTRLVRTADLRSFRGALAALAIRGSALDTRNRLLVVPTRAAAAHLIRSLEDRLSTPGAVILPDLVTREELTARFFDRLPAESVAPLSLPEREALLAATCRGLIEAGANPPFRLRPGLIAAMLDFFDSLKRHQKSVDDFERLAIGRLEPDAGADRGADRLIRQTRFLAAAFRGFERRCSEIGGLDEHVMRHQVLATPTDRPWRHVIVAVRDRACDPYGLYPVDWDLLARAPGLEQLDVVVTDETLAGRFHQQIHQLLPGIEEVRVESDESLPAPVLVLSPDGAQVHTGRDREEEVAGFARWVRATVRDGASALDRTALVVRQRLPYVYLAREVFRSAGIPAQMFDALPLAAEPYAAALDVLFSFIGGNGGRIPSIALLRSPHFTFRGSGQEPVRGGDIAALDRALSEAGYLGDLGALERLVGGWNEDGSRTPHAARRGGAVLLQIARELLPLRSAGPIAEHLDRILGFVTSCGSLPGPDDPLRARQLRARSAILGLLRALRDANRRFDGATAEFEEVAAMVRRGIDAQTFAPRTGDSGVHLVDADSARFGEFDRVQLAGLVDGEWPDRPRRNIFYSAAILRDLGWPAESDRLNGARGAFLDLLRLPGRELVLSTFSLEHDAIVAPSGFVDEIDTAGLTARPSPVAKPVRIFDFEALGSDPLDMTALSPGARVWAQRRLDAPMIAERLRGRTGAHVPGAFSVSSLERYQDCPFKFFASDVLRLDETPEDEATLSPRARGRFIHEVFQRFFEQWDRERGQTITSDLVDEARAVCARVAGPLLDRLPEADASLERARLFGSAISIGIVDVVLGLEASRPVDVDERLLEYRLEGDFTLGEEGRRVPLRGVADRIDLLSGRRLRVIDYKSGYAPQPKRALQIPVYSACARERLAEQRGGDWTVDEAAYVAFTGKRNLVTMIKAGKGDGEAVLRDAQTRLIEIVDGIQRGEFHPKPYDPRICTYCAYPSVCRKDYVGDQ